MKNPTTIVAVDDHPLIRQAIRSLVADREDMTLVGEGSVGEHLFPLVAEHRPDVVLLDLNMPHFEVRGDDGTPDIFSALPMIARLHKEYPETAVIILSEYIIPSVVHEGVGYDNLKGYLLKSDNLSLMLSEAIDMINNGGVAFSQAIRQELLASPEKTGKPLLTKRQTQVITTIAQTPNASYAHHAKVLGISESTLRNHLSAAFKALGVNSITAAILRCQELGIIPTKPGVKDR